MLDYLITLVRRIYEAESRIHFEHVGECSLFCCWRRKTRSACEGQAGLKQKRYFMSPWEDLTDCMAIIIQAIQQKGLTVTQEKLSRNEQFFISQLARIINNSQIDNMQGLRQVKISRNISFHENKLLGQGTYGKVYEGIIEKFGKVAVKVISLDAVNRKLLQKQESILQKIYQVAHPNCTTYYGVIKKEDQETREAYFLFELCQESLLDLLFSYGAIPQSKVRKYFLDFMEGLSFLHSQGIIHRDLKPDNLLLSKDRLKIADFGLSCDLNNSYDPIKMTEKVGAQVYRAPQLASGSYDYLCDVWSAGLILLQMLTGKIDENYSARNIAIQKGIYKFQLQSFDPFWEEIIKKMLTYDKNKRPTSFQILEMYKKWSIEQIQKISQPAENEFYNEEIKTQPLFLGFRPSNNEEKEALISPVQQIFGQNNLQMSLVESFREKDYYHSVLEFVNHFEFYHGYKKVSFIAQTEVLKTVLALGNAFNNFYVRSVLFFNISCCYLRFKIMIKELQKGAGRIQTINNIQPQQREKLVNYINGKLDRFTIFVKQFEDQQALNKIDKLLSYQNKFPEIKSKYPLLLKLFAQLRINIKSVNFAEIRPHIQSLERQIISLSQAGNFLILKASFLFNKIFDFSRILEQKDKNYPDFNQISHQLQNVKQETVKEYFSSSYYKSK